MNEQVITEEIEESTYTVKKKCKKEYDKKREKAKKIMKKVITNSTNEIGNKKE